MSQSHALRKQGRRCKECGRECHPDAVTRHGYCYECSNVQQGRGPIEEHHVFGRGKPDSNKNKVKIPGNDHRVLGAKHDRRPDVLRRPGDNPLHRIAANVVTLGEAATAFAEFARLNHWLEWSIRLAVLLAAGADSVADWLLILAGKLEDRLGPGWADDLGMPLWQL
jgi:hypothetical protein